VAAIETVFVVTGEEYAFLSSSLIRQIAAFSGSTEKLRPFVPPNVAEAIQGMMADPSRPLRRLATELESD
jgi:phosphopantetheine adenylyltransferase